MSIILLDNFTPVSLVPLEPGTQKAVYNNKVVLVFKESELLYDISNLAFVEGDIMPTQDEHDRHQVFDIAEDGNIDRVRRVLGLAHAECVELLYPYSRKCVGSSEYRDDVLTEEDEYAIMMKVPADMSRTTIDLLEKQIHEYMICRVLVDWMSITNLKNPVSAQNWKAKLEEAKEEIQTLMNARIRRVRRTQTPF